MRRLILLVLCLSTITAHAADPGVRIVGEAGQWRLERDGQPYFVKGVGGDGSLELLAKLGGNSVRTWGEDGLGKKLDEAHQHGLTVTAGIWLGQVRQGFDWSDAESLIRQRQKVREVVERHKNHPALLVWALGNEMEDPAGKNGAVWAEINNLARLVKSIDSRHPTMTVVAEIGGDKVKNLHALCPDIDLIGINSYAGAASVGERYRKLDGTKPYLLTEFGPPGIWEISKDENGAYHELTSTEKAESYRKAYRSAVLGQPGVCLGSYAFLWGQKQEVTATWFSMLHDGSRVAAADALAELWSGKPVANRCPAIESFSVVRRSASQADDAERRATLNKPGDIVRVELKCSDPERDSLTVSWQLRFDPEEYGSGGDAEAEPPAVKNAVVRSDATSAEVKVPTDGGLYRIFAVVKDQHGGAAVANLPLRVDAPLRALTARKAEFPLIVYAEADSAQSYIPAGWMGDTKAIKLDPLCAEQPHSGKTCLRCDFTADKGWGGVVWQNPAQDWGDRAGGFDLTGAKRLTFWAKGDKGGEVVGFKFGIVGREKRFFDTGTGSIEKVTLTKDWKQYEISLGKQDLTRIKTGFVWNLASSGEPITFYLDDVQWEQ